MKITAGFKKFMSTISDSTLDPDSQVLVGIKYLILAALIRNLQLAFELVSDTLTVIWIWTLLQLATTNLLNIPWPVSQDQFSFYWLPRTRGPRLPNSWPLPIC